MSDYDHMTLTLTPKQVSVILEALDLFQRLGMGQLDALRAHYSIREATHIDTGAKIPWDPRVVDEALLGVKRAVFAIEGHSRSYGIAHQGISNVYRVAYDLQQVVRREHAFARHPEGGITVDFDDPLQYGVEPLATAKVMAKEVPAPAHTLVVEGHEALLLYCERCAGGLEDEVSEIMEAGALATADTAVFRSIALCAAGGVV